MNEIGVNRLYIKKYKMKEGNIIKRLILMTLEGMKFFFIQLLMLIIISWCFEILLSCLGYSSRQGISGLVLGIAIVECVMAYTMIFCWFYAIFPKKPFIIPYIIYMLGVYLYIVQINDWNFQRVTIDSYMVIGWCMPIFGAFVYTAIKVLKQLMRFINNHLIKSIMKKKKDT